MRMLTTLPREWTRPALMGDIFSDFDRLVDGLLQPTAAADVGFQPTCDVSETKDHYLLSFDMPGMRKEDIKIEVEGNRLLVYGERFRETRQGTDETTLRHERHYGRFVRTFGLPATINADKIEAHYENGVLNLALPKVEAAKARAVPIQTGPTTLFSKFLGAKKEEPTEVKVN